MTNTKKTLRINTMDTREAWDQTVAFERELKAGDVVHARWTNCNTLHDATVRIVRVNRCSARIEILETASEGYPQGYKITVKLFTASWSWNNGIFPASLFELVTVGGEPEENTQEAFLAAMGAF